MNEFKCQECGNCCRNFGIINEEFPRFSNFNVILFSEPKLIIYDWEKECFDKEDLVPYEVFYDTQKNITIVLSYTLNKDPCPNLSEDNKCKIYARRPITCRTFPAPYANVNDLKTRKSLFNNASICKAELPPKQLYDKLGFVRNNNQFDITNGDLIKNSYNRYGDVFVYRFLKFNSDGLMNKILVELQKKGAFNFANEKQHNLKDIVLKINNSPKIGFSELFKKFTNFDVWDNFNEASFKKIEEIIKKI